MSENSVQYLERVDKPKLAYVFSPANAVGKDLPAVMFCGGFRSDMMGTKATYFEEQCIERGQAYLRFDYTGHGLSGGDFQKDGSIGQWLEDACDIFDHCLVDCPVVVVGSSMGGWIGLLFAQAREQYVRGFIGLAAAPDFTERVYRDEFSDEHRVKIKADGFIEIPNEYSDEPYIFTAQLFEDAKRYLILNQDHTHDFPIVLFQGMRDSSVSNDVPLAIKERYKGGSLDVIFIDDGDHRLSRPSDLRMVGAEIHAMSQPQV